MKKLLALLTIVCMMLAMAGCGSLYSQYESAYKKTEKLDQVDADMSLNISIKLGGEGVSSSMNIPLDANVKVVLDDDKKIEKMDLSLDMNMDLGIYATDIKLNAIYIDEVTYLSMTLNTDGNENVEKFKLIGNINDQENSSGGFDDLSSSIDIDEIIDEEAINEAEVENKNGSTVIKPDVSKKLVKLINDALEEVFSSFSAMAGTIGFIPDNIKATDAEIEYTIDKNGYLSKTVCDVTMEAETQGMTFEMGIDVKFELNDPGEKVKITAPADKDSYETKDIDDATSLLPGGMDEF